MHINITFGWWFLPVAVLVIGLPWALWQREDEKSSPDDIFSFPDIINPTLRTILVLIVAFVAAVTWAVMK